MDDAFFSKMREEEARLQGQLGRVRRAIAAYLETATADKDNGRRVAGRTHEERSRTAKAIWERRRAKTAEAPLPEQPVPEKPAKPHTEHLRTVDEQLHDKGAS